MKNILRNFRLLSLVCVILTLSNCQVEENLDQKNHLQNDQLNYSIKNLSSNEITSNSKIIENLKKLTVNSKNPTAKTIAFNELGFIINTEYAKYIEKGNYNSYTFSTVQNGNENIKNVLFSINETGEYDTFLVEYGYTKSELLNFSPDKMMGKATITPINNINIRSLTARSAPLWVCKYDYELIDKGDLMGVGNNQYEWVLIASSCEVIYADIIADSNIPSGNGTTTYTTSGSIIGSGGGGGIVTTPTPSLYDLEELIKISVVKTKLNVTAQQSRFLDQNGQIGFEIYDFLTYRIFSEESIIFSRELLNYCIANPLNSDSETTELFFKAIRATDNLQDNLTESFVQDNISYFSQDVQNQILIDPLLAAQIAQEYLIQRAVKKYLHPTWNEVQIYYSVLWDLRHMALDAYGLIPVIGEVADLANGTLYTIEGDKVNAAFSFASAVPVAGWAAVGVKYAVKIKTVATIGTKVKLTWKVLADGTIYFGTNNTCRAQLRKVLGLAVGNLNQAHHIIPLNLQTNTIVQKAFKSADAFHMNEALNGIPLSTAVHNGSHANYDAKIFQKLEVFRVANPNATPKQCYDKVVDVINQIRTAIQNSPNTPINQLNF